MANYRLVRQSDLAEWLVDARDDADAAAKFGEMLGLKLTLDEGQAASQYMMQAYEEREPKQFTRPPDIGVWKAD